MRTIRALTVSVGVLVVSLASGGVPASAAGAATTSGTHSIPVYRAVRAVPVVPVQIAAGPSQSCAILSNRTVECWGWNLYGQLGNGTTALATHPVAVAGLANVEQISLGFGHTCALLYTGVVECWGWNANGQLGDGTEQSTLRPVQVKDLTSVKQVAVGFETSCALLFSGSVRCWGWNVNGELGDGTTGTTQTPVSVVGLSGVREISVGYAHSCAVVVRGAVRCWGLNDEGQLGDGGTTQSTTPVSVRGLVGVRSLSLGFKHTCAVLGSGSVKCWGWNQFGQLGDGTNVSSPTPVDVLHLNDAIQIGSAYGDTCALLSTKRIRCWGWNHYGGLGTSSHASSRVPVTTRYLADVVQLAVGDDHSCAILSAHDYSCWGNNTYGDLGNGTRANANAPDYLPTAPEAVRAQSLAGAALVSWHPPHLDGGTPKLSYTVTSAAGQHLCTVPIYSCRVAGLTNGVTYRFLVTASNVVGSSRPSASPAVIPATVPNPPTTVVAQREDDAALVSWLAPASDGGHPIESYTATASPGGDTCRTAGLSCSVHGLTNGDPYTFTVTATNQDGPSVGSAPSAPVTPAAVPGQPTGVVATPGNLTASVTWTAPISNGSTITAYDVVATDLTTPANGAETCATSGAIGCTVSGLTNGDHYTFTVTAKNVVGAGPASAPSAAVTPATLPGAPTGVAAVPGDQSAVVSWTPPASTGGDPITGYTVTATDGTTKATVVQACTTSEASGCTITGLTDGDPYTFTVTATTLAGTSTASTPSAAVTPAAVPGPPTDVVAVPGDTTAAVTWTAPTSDGGSPVTGYVVTDTDLTSAAREGQSCSTTGATGCTVTGLTDGDSYTFTVTASNAAGPGTPSSASSPLVIGALPTRPTAVSATPGNAVADVVWSAPSSDGGLTITGYDVTATDHTHSAKGGESCSTAGTIGCTVEDLTNGDSYTFTVTASNEAGSGPASTASTAVTPYTVPDAPSAVVATSGDTTADVTWSAPGFDGGSTITGYTVLATDQTTSLQGGGCSTTGATGCTVTGLTDGDSYTFTVTASNVAGPGTPSSASAPIVPAAVPGAPTGVLATPGDMTAGVTWTAPGSDGGSPISGYTVLATDQTNSLNGGEGCSTTGATGCTVTGLANGDAYTFTVTASNGAGTGAASTPSTAVTPYTVPDAPSSVVATPGDTTADVTWSAPGFDGGSTITGYTVLATDQTNSLNGGEGCSTTGATGCTVTDLTDGDAYTFTVTASNAAGLGPASDPSSPATPMLGLMVLHVDVIDSIDAFNASYLGSTAPVRPAR